MNPISKQRLVGSLLLMGLAVVFWPIIFVQPIVNRPINLSAAPAPPRPGPSARSGPPPPRRALWAGSRPLERDQPCRMVRLVRAVVWAVV